MTPSPENKALETVTTVLHEKFGVQCNMKERASWHIIARAALDASRLEALTRQGTGEPGKSLGQQLFESYVEDLLENHKWPEAMPRYREMWERAATSFAAKVGGGGEVDLEDVAILVRRIKANAEKCSIRGGSPFLDAIEYDAGLILARLAPTEGGS